MARKRVPSALSRDSEHSAPNARTAAGLDATTRIRATGRGHLRKGGLESRRRIPVGRGSSRWKWRRSTEDPG